jgi:hypothetical protein
MHWHRTQKEFKQYDPCGGQTRSLAMAESSPDSAAGRIPTAPHGRARAVLAAVLTATVALLVGPVALAGTSGGRMWHLQSPAVPAGSILSDLGSVSCVHGGPCAAVGYYELSDGSYHNLFEIWNGTIWTVHSAPADIGLNAISCPAARYCMAVGSVTTSGHSLLQAELWHGGAWTAHRFRNPNQATPSYLTSVSCPSRSACTAIGVIGRGGSTRPLVEHWNGSRWRRQYPPMSEHGTELTSVSCASGRACMAVGFSGFAMFTESSHGTTWTVHRQPRGSLDGFLDGVSCTAANACTAVGYDERSRQLPLAERWNGHRWAVERTAAPPSGESGSFASVSCAGPNNCVAVGRVQENPLQDKLLAERWNGWRWAVQTTPTPVGATLASLLGVSCSSVFTCEAVGYFAIKGKSSMLLAERYS